MSDASRAGTGNFVRETVAPGRERPGVGIVWLDRLSLVASYRGHPLPEVPHGERTATVGATVEVPPGFLVVDVRIGYATAAGAFVGELRFVDLEGQRTSALLLLERSPAGDEPAESLFVAAPTTPTGERSFLSVRASVTDSAEHVAVRRLQLCLTRA